MTAMKTFEIDIAHDCPLGDYLEALEKIQTKNRIIHRNWPWWGKSLYDSIWNY